AWISGASGYLPNLRSFGVRTTLMSYQNKKGAGYYNRPLTRLVRTEDDSNAYASKEYTFAPNGDQYYGHVQQTGSTEAEINGRLLTKTAVKIEVRGWVSLNTLDRLVDQQFSETYIIDSIARGDDELVVIGYRL